MSFEQAAWYSEVVVLGMVVEIPEFAVEVAQSGVVRRNRVRVEQYLKGHGPDEIAVITLGGKFVRETADGRVVREASTDGAPQLPAVGTEVVLFLRPSSDGFVPSSWSHGVVPVQTASDRTRTVIFSFQDTRMMPKGCLDSVRESRPDETVLRKPVTCVVRPEELRQLFDRLARGSQ